MTGDSGFGPGALALPLGFSLQRGRTLPGWPIALGGVRLDKVREMADGKAWPKRTVDDWQAMAGFDRHV
ncbi:MAG: hypothetical protein AAGK71_07235 [Pseudomonadota bacterium]